MVMNSVHQDPCLFATTSLAHSVFQLCGSYGIQPSRSLDCGDYENVVRAPMPDPLQFNTASDYAKAYLSYNLLRKYDSFPISLDRRAAASASFDESEVQCGRINLQVDALPYVPGVPLAHQQQSYVESARSLIKRALGKFDWEEFQTVCDFSGGASTRLPRKSGNAMFKLMGKPQVTINCRDLAVHFIWCNALWRKLCQETYGRDSDPYSWVEVVVGSRFETVPKDSLIDRPICIEPELNMFFQKAIGAMLKRRLKRRGINLSDQKRNQFLARLGSLTGLLATIDLTAASDSVAMRICELLLPREWFEAMCITRSPYVHKDGKWVRLEKMSSMGNGFTFELESLIFWALSMSVCTSNGVSVEDLSVYGDDIVVPSVCAESLIELLATLGFKANKNKTFFSGPFRESCGKHYFLGADVSPFKITQPIDTWAELYHFCNNLRSWGWACPDTVDSIVSNALKSIPPRNRCYVPMNFGSKTGLRVANPPKPKVYCATMGSFVYKFSYMKEDTTSHDMSGPYAYLASMLLREQRSPSDPMSGVSWSIQDPYSARKPDPSDITSNGACYDSLSRKSDRAWRVCNTSSSVWCEIGRAHV